MHNQFHYIWKFHIWLDIKIADFDIRLHIFVCLEIRDFPDQL